MCLDVSVGSGGQQGGGGFEISQVHVGNSAFQISREIS